MHSNTDCNENGNENVEFLNHDQNRLFGSALDIDVDLLQTVVTMLQQQLPPTSSLLDSSVPLASSISSTALHLSSSTPLNFNGLLLQVEQLQTQFLSMNMNGPNASTNAAVSYKYALYCLKLAKHSSSSSSSSSLLTSSSKTTASAWRMHAAKALLQCISDLSRLSTLSAPMHSSTSSTPSSASYQSMQFTDVSSSSQSDSLLREQLGHQDIKGCGGNQREYHSQSNQNKASPLHISRPLDMLLQLLHFHAALDPALLDLLTTRLPLLHHSLFDHFTDSLFAYIAQPVCSKLGRIVDRMTMPANVSDSVDSTNNADKCSDSGICRGQESINLSANQFRETTECIRSLYSKLLESILLHSTSASSSSSSLSSNAKCIPAYSASLDETYPSCLLNPAQIGVLFQLHCAFSTSLSEHRLQEHVCLMKLIQKCSQSYKRSQSLSNAARANSNFGATFSLISRLSLHLQALSWTWEDETLSVLQLLENQMPARMKIMQGEIAWIESHISNWQTNGEVNYDCTSSSNDEKHCNTNDSIKTGNCCPIATDNANSCVVPKCISSSSDACAVGVTVATRASGANMKKEDVRGKMQLQYLQHRKHRIFITTLLPLRKLVDKIEATASSTPSISTFCSSTFQKQPSCSFVSGTIQRQFQRHVLPKLHKLLHMFHDSDTDHNAVDNDDAIDSASQTTVSITTSHSVHHNASEAFIGSNIHHPLHNRDPGQSVGQNAGANAAVEKLAVTRPLNSARSLAQRWEKQGLMLIELIRRCIHKRSNNHHNNDDNLNHSKPSTVHVNGNGNIHTHASISNGAHMLNLRTLSPLLADWHRFAVNPITLPINSSITDTYDAGVCSTVPLLLPGMTQHIDPHLDGQIDAADPCHLSGRISVGNLSRDSIIAVRSEVRQLNTKSRPKILRFLCGDGHEYSYLLKGKEDIQVDAQIMRISKAVNISTRRWNVRRMQTSFAASSSGLSSFASHLSKKHLDRLGNEDKAGKHENDGDDETENETDIGVGNSQDDEIALSLLRMVQWQFNQQTKHATHSIKTSSVDDVSNIGVCDSGDGRDDDLHGDSNRSSITKIPLPLYRNYSVVPLSNQCGVIRIVKHVTSIMDLFRNWQTQTTKAQKSITKSSTKSSSLSTNWNAINPLCCTPSVELFNRIVNEELLAHSHIKANGHDLHQHVNDGHDGVPNSSTKSNSNINHNHKLGSSMNVLHPLHFSQDTYRKNNNNKNNKSNSNHNHNHNHNNPSHACAVPEIPVAPVLSRRHWPKSVLRRVYCRMMQMAPKDLLLKEMYCSGT
jgi:hypothetical protein